MKKLATISFAVVIGFLSFVIVPAQEIPMEIKGGFLNGKATDLPPPEYPADAKAAGVEGTVLVDVVIDGSGTIISVAAQPEVVKTTSGNELGEKVNTDYDLLLRQAAEKAAWDAKFTPTTLSGVPVKVSGTIIYDFSSFLKTANGSAAILNGKATTLPKPKYPDAAKASRAGGSVVVRVVVNENGDVVAATAVLGHPLLRAAGVDAAKAAKFSPTLVDGPSIKVSGLVVYNFVP